MTRTLPGIVFLLVLVLTTTAVAVAGDDTWSPLGPDGGRMFDIAVDANNPGTLYGATFTGVFKSTDSGVTWVRRAGGIPEDNNLTVGAVAVSPSDPNLVLTATRAGYLYRSTDAALTWADSSSGITPVTSGYVDGWIRFDPATPTTVYAGFPSSPVAVYRSTDSGADWTAVTTGLTGSRLKYLAVTPTIPPTLYALTSGTDGGLFMSTGSGDTWSGINGNLPVPSHGDWVSCAAADAGTAGRLYAVCSGDGEVYRSDDNGTGWTAVTSSAPRYSQLWVHPGTGTVYGVGETEADPWWEHLYASTDSGVTWNDLTPGHFNPESLAFDPATPARLYAGLSGGFFTSADSGATWTSRNTGLRCFDASAVAIAPSDPSYLYLGSSQDGSFRSSDGGLTTTPIHVGLSMPCGEALAVHPTDPLMVITDSYPPHLYDTFPYADSGIVTSGDGGDSWTRVPNPMDGTIGEYGMLQAWDIIYDPASASVVYAASPGYNEPLYLSYAGVFKSVDGGATFSHASTGLPTGTTLFVQDLAAAATIPTTLFVAMSSNGLYRSNDGGAYWTAAVSGPLDGLSVRSVAVHPSTPTTVLAGANDGTNSIFKSTDGGATWSASSTGLTDLAVTTIVFDTLNPRIVYAATSGDGVYRSRDGGTTWEALNSGLDLPSVWDLVIDPSDPNHLAAALRGGWYEIDIDPALFSDGFESGNTAAWSVAVGQ